MRTAIEVIAAGYAVFYLLVVLMYRPTQRRPPRTSSEQPDGAVVATYLCCDDLDTEALESIVANVRHACAFVVVHDDSSTAAARVAVDAAVESLRARYQTDLRILRRGDKAGGKPGAVNNVLRSLPKEIGFLVLCDSDSYVLDAGFVTDALQLFDNPAIAIVQARNVGHVRPADSEPYQRLALAIDYYDVFASFLDRFGWSPFLGHNAVLRISAVREVGQFTPGQLADDIDMSVKLRLAGYRTRYARHLACGERHPQTNSALRRRTAKWSYGCTQILLRWTWRLATCRAVSIMELVTLFLTVSYYPLQALLLAYLIAVHVALPFHDPLLGGPLRLAMSSGLILALTFMPSLAYFSAIRSVRRWPAVSLSWSLTYGSQELLVLAAITRCLGGAGLAWTPTNKRIVGDRAGRCLPEVAMGVVILLVAVVNSPLLLLCPATIFFSAKFLVTPFLDRWMFRSVEPSS